MTATERDTTEKLRAGWRRFAEKECGTYSPLYRSISDAVADDDGVLALLAEVPLSGRQPNMLLAAVHYLLLKNPDHPLATIYAGGGDADDAPRLFTEFVCSRPSAISELLRTRRTQTNEPGRSAVLAWGLGAVSEVLGDEIALLDAGCSAGLNLLVDLYRLDYEPGPSLGPPDSPVAIKCRLSGPNSFIGRVPRIADRIGLDRRPIDLTDPDQVRWLLACVWPDTGRMDRTSAAIELAREVNPRILTGDMVADLDKAIDQLAPHLPVVVFTSWACAYLDIHQRNALIELLFELAGRRRFLWLSAEGPGVIPAISIPDIMMQPLEPSSSVVGLVTFDSGVEGRALGSCHAHGGWIRA